MTAHLDALLRRARRHMIADLARAPRFWSVRLSALGTLMMASWTALPPETRAHLPHSDWIAAAMFLMTFVTRLLAQPEARR